MPHLRHLIAPIISLLILFGAAAPFAEEAAQKMPPELAMPKIREETATRIAMLAMKVVGYPAYAEYDYTGEYEYDPGFLEFWIYSPGEAAITPLGNIAINMYTGDVWENFYCDRIAKKKIVSPQIRQAQDEIRRTSVIPKAEYVRLAKRVPYCLFP